MDEKNQALRTKEAAEECPAASACAGTGSGERGEDPMGEAAATCDNRERDIAARNLELCGDVGTGGFNKTLGVEFLVAEPDRVEARMPIGSHITQPFGLVHGGATIALLESVASLGAQLRCNLDTEQPFGVDVHVRHRKSGRAGYVRGVAEYDREEPSHGRAGGIKQYWTVTAYDDAGDVMSEGTIVVKVVEIARLAARDA